MDTNQRLKDQILILQCRLAALGEMIGTIAHQWRQPLNNVALIIQNVQIQYNSGTLTVEEMNSDISDAMEIILHLSHTIDEFRNFSREDSTKNEFFISKVVRRAVELVLPLSEKSQY